MLRFFKSKALLDQALEGRARRQDLIASNIANIDTPFYKARDLDFESYLKDAASDIYKKQEKPLKTTNPKHFASDKKSFLATSLPAHQQLEIRANAKIKGTIFARDAHMVRNDANTVDLDVETSEMSKNAAMVQALDGIVKKQGDMIKIIVDTSSKIN